VALRIALLAALFLGAFALLVVPVALLLAWRSGESGLTVPALLGGIVCGLTVALFLIIFHFRRESLCVPVEDRPTFVQQLRGQLEELGYAVAENDEALVGRPGFHSFLLGGKIVARVEDAGARLTGPKVYLELIRRRLRVHTHLEQVSHRLSVLKLRQGGIRLKEVRLKLSVPGEILPALYDHLAATLNQEGAEIHCELSLRARCAEGLRNQFFEARVHDWLKEQQIPVEIDKEPFTPAASPPREKVLAAC
jgi:hypothetical protein